MNKFKCCVCSQDLSPKKKLQCKNQNCSNNCHYACDPAILKATVAKKLEYYSCQSCREEGDLLVYKEHKTRSKSPATVTITKSNNPDVTPCNGRNTRSKTRTSSSSDKTSPLRNKDDISLGNEEVEKSPNRENESSLLKPCISKHSSPGRSKSASPAGKADKPYKLIEKKDASTIVNISNATPVPLYEKHTQTTDQNPTTGIKAQVDLEVKLQEAENQLTSLKDMLAEKSEECTRLHRTVDLRTEQFKLLRETLREEIDKKQRFQATLVIRETHIEKLEQVVEELKAPIFTGTISTQTDNRFEEILAQNTMLQHDINLKEENINSLNIEIQKLKNQNNELQDTIYSYDYHNLSLRNQKERNDNYEKDIEIKNDLIKEISESNENLEKNNTHMKAKLQKIHEILQEDQDYPHLPSTPGLRENHHSHQIDDRSYRDAAANNGNRSVPRPEDMMSGVSPISSISSQRDTRYDTRSIANTSMQSQRRHSNSSYNDQRKEKDEIHRKRKNIIIYGMPEMDNNQQSMEEFIHINRFLGNRNFQKRDIYSIGRIGDKNGDRPRPLKIEFYETTTKINVMKNAYRLKDHRRYSHISIQHDLTRNQLQEFYHLKDEARKRELEEGNRNIIYRVKGPPGNWKIMQLSKN